MTLKGQGERISRERFCRNRIQYYLKNSFNPQHATEVFKMFLLIRNAMVWRVRWKLKLPRLWKRMCSLFICKIETVYHPDLTTTK